MKVFLDSDVLLDFLSARNFDLAEIKVILDMGVKNKLKLYTSPLVIANIYYLLSKFETPKKAISKIKKLLVFIKILSIGEKEVLEGVNSKFKDFEDSMQYYAAVNSKLDIIVTRNIKDFKLSQLPVMTP